jgi:hypothetical protein
MTTVLEASTAAQSGLIVFGYDYAWIGLRDGKLVQVTVMKAAEKPVATEQVAPGKIIGPVHLRVTVTDGGKCRFSYSTDGQAFTPLGDSFTANVGRWVGAKAGLFAAGREGYADFESFIVAPKP